MSEVKMQYKGGGQFGTVSFIYDSETNKILQIADIRVDDNKNNDLLSLTEVVNHKNDKDYYAYVTKYMQILTDYGFNGNDIEEKFNDALNKLSACIKNKSDTPTINLANLAETKSSLENLNKTDEEEDNQNDTSGLKTKLEDLYSKLSNSNVNSTYIYLKIGDLEINSNNKSYVASIEYNRNGSDENQGSSLSINLIYRCSNINGTLIDNLDLESNPDPNTLELSILAAMFKETVCQFQYGYSSPELILSPKYNILITDCTCEIQNKYFIYSITGYSVGLSIKNDTLSKIDGNSTEITYTSNETPTEVVERLVNLYNSNNKNDKKINLSWVSYSSTQKSVKSSDRNFTDSSEGVDIDNYGNKKQGLVGKYTHKFEDNTIFQEIDYFLKKAVHKSDNVENIDKPEPNDYAYGFRIKDSSDKNTQIDTEIYLKDLKITSESDSISVYTYNMLDTDNSVVLDFKTGYHGNYLKAEIDKNLLEVDTHTQNKIYLLDPKLIRNGGVVTQDAIEANNRNIIKALSSSSYTATLQVVGTPIDIPIRTTIRVVPLINGLKHHSEGLYQINSIKDTIDTTGYRTTFELLKVPNTDDKQYENLSSLLSGNLKNYLDTGIYAYADPQERVKELYQDEVEEKFNQNMFNHKIAISSSGMNITDMKNNKMKSFNSKK